MRIQAVLTACFLLCGAAAHAQDASTLVSQMQNAERSVSYSATQKSGNGGTARLFRSGLKRRLEWLAPSVKRGDVLVDDGQHVTLYHRAEKSAIQTDSRSRVPVFAPAGAATKMRFAGRAAFSVPVAGNRTIIIDGATKALLAIRGARGGGFSLENIHFAPVSAGKFAFVAPSGVSVQKFDGTLFNNPGAAQRAASWLKTPSKLPSGWRFESAIAGQSSAWLRYSNNQSRFSLFEQPTSDGDLAPHAVDGGTFWRSGGVRILATGISGSALNELIANLK